MKREPDWKRMYMELLGKTDEALDILPLYPENAKVYELLKAGMQAAEDIYCEEGKASDA